MKVWRCEGRDRGEKKFECEPFLVFRKWTRISIKACDTLSKGSDRRSKDRESPEVLIPNYSDELDKYDNRFAKNTNTFDDNTKPCFPLEILTS